MSFGLFEHMAHSDSEQRNERRKAIALARVRANKRFGSFLSKEGNMDRESRLTLVAGDLNDTVRQACAECGYSDWETVRDAITASLGFQVEAVRMPKMCPYHREVTDISLAAGQADAGFSAMAQHAWGGNHCQGEWDGKCNFKPAMTTQTYWDNKAEKAQERREQQQQQFQQEQPVQDAEQVDYEVTEVISEPEFAEEAISDSESYNSEPQADLQPAMARRQAEALKTIDPNKDLDGHAGEPHMDKRKWTPQNISWDRNPEMPGSPVPTREQDIAARPNYSADGAFEDDGRFEQTNAVLEKQNVVDGIEELSQPGPSQWTGTGGQANPVTAAKPVDPDKNPLEDEEDEEKED